MLRAYTLLFLIILFLVSCRGVRSIPVNYAQHQQKERSHMLAIFMDGTRKIPRQQPWKNSHVKTTHNLAFTNIRSLYIEGVGAKNRVKDTKHAITTGKRIMRAYRFIAGHYSPGDSICLFGFSRGANQCRILAGFIFTIGIIDLKEIKNEDGKQQLLLDLYTIYSKTIGVSAKRTKMIEYINQWKLQHTGQELTYDTSGGTRIELMALWDTVEAFVVNDTLETTTPLPVHLNQLYNVKKLFHALSLDDNRAYNYTPVLATHKDVALHPGQQPDSIVEEVWFNGSHKDVGGGFRKKKNDQLSGISLKWMWSKVKPYHILRDTTIVVNPFGRVNDMRRNLFLKMTSPGDTLRGINKYWDLMNINWNKHRIKVHQTVIDRLAKGYVQDFKMKKGRLSRLDWYDWEPFRECFVKVNEDGKIKIRFKDDCSCIERVND